MSGTSIIAIISMSLNHVCPLVRKVIHSLKWIISTYRRTSHGITITCHIGIRVFIRYTYSPVKGA